VVRRYQSLASFVCLLLLGQFRLLQCEGVSSCEARGPC